MPWSDPGRPSVLDHRSVFNKGSQCGAKKRLEGGESVGVWLQEWRLEVNGEKEPAH